MSTTDPTVSNAPALGPWAMRGLVLLALVGFLWGYGERALNEPDEGRYGSIASAMVRNGDYLTPRLYGRTHFAKPPLAYWLMAGSLQAGGQNEWMARLPSMCAALGVAFLCADLAGRRRGTNEAFMTILMFLAAPMFYVMARVADPNMLLTFSTTVSLWSAYRWRESGRRIFMLLFYAGLPMAMMTKGPVGLAIVLLTLAADRWLPGPRTPYRLWNPVGAALALFAGTVWYFLSIRTYPGLLDFFLRDELYERAFTTEHGRSQPFWYFLAILPMAILPWLPFIGRGLFHAVAARRTDGYLRFLLAWLIPGLIMFSLSGSKLPAYILPLVPAVLLLAVEGAQRHAPTGSGWRASPLLALTMLAGIVLAGHVTLGWPTPISFYVTGSALAIALAVIGWRWIPVRLQPVAATVLALSSLVAAQDLATRNEQYLGRGTAARSAARAFASLPGKPGPLYVIEDTVRGLDFYGVNDVIPPRTPTRPHEVGDPVFDALRFHDGVASIQHKARRQNNAAILTTLEGEAALTNGYLQLHRQVLDGGRVLLSKKPPRAAEPGQPK